MYKSFFKRGIDISVALILCFALVPVLFIVFILVKIDSPGPLFFKQERVGRNLRFFYILKFRTMTHEKREVGIEPIIGRGMGVTPVGFYLRRFKLDELPQVFNVLLGDLSLVGPRPSVKEQLANMTEEEKKRYSIRPGLTGLSQVSGNIHLSWKKRYQMDLEYVRNYSIQNDIKILFRTFTVICKGEDYYLNKPLKLEK